MVSADLDTPPRLKSHSEARQAAERYAEGLRPGVIERDRAGADRIPHQELAAFDRSGLLALTIPEEHGGSGLGPSTLAEVTQIIAAVDPAIAQGPQGHYLFLDVILALGNEQQKQRLLGDVLAGKRIANALAERGGANAQDLKTRISGAPLAGAEPTASTGPITLNGKKYYTTGSLTAHRIAVSALDAEDRLLIAFVERDQPGVKLDTDWDVMGQRATVSGSITFEDVQLDPALVLPYWRAFEAPQQLGARAQLYHAAIETGIARGALSDARWFLTERARPFFEAARAGWADTAANDPHTTLRFGRIATQVEAAEALLARAAATLDQIGLIPADADAAARGSVAVAQAKAFASEVAVNVASELFSLTGASAADEKHDLSRHWRNARTHSSHDPVDWKYHHAGAYLLSGTIPPNHGQL